MMLSRSLQREDSTAGERVTTDAMTSRYHDRIPGRNVLCNHIPVFVTYMTPFIDMLYSLVYFVFLEAVFLDQDSRNLVPAQ